MAAWRCAPACGPGTYLTPRTYLNPPNSLVGTRSCDHRTTRTAAGARRSLKRIYPLTTRTVLLTGTCRAPATVGLRRGGSSTKRRWHNHRPLHRRPGKEGPAPAPRGTGGLPPPRPEQLRVEGSPFEVSRRESAGLASRVSATRPSRLYSTNEKVKRSYRPGGQGRRAGGRGRGRLFLAGEGPQVTPLPAPSEG